MPSGSLTIPSSVTNGGTTYSITSIGNYAFYDRTGRRVTTFERQSTIDLSRFATGIYILRVILPERIEVRRVVKQ